MSRQIYLTCTLIESSYYIGMNQTQVPFSLYLVNYFFLLFNEHGTSQLFPNNSAAVHFSRLWYDRPDISHKRSNFHPAWKGKIQISNMDRVREKYISYMTVYPTALCDPLPALPANWNRLLSRCWCDGYLNSHQQMACFKNRYSILFFSCNRDNSLCSV